MIDTSLFDKTLAKAIEQHQALEVAASIADTDRERAANAIPDAEAADVAEIAASRVAGKDDPEPQRTEEAERVAALAAREADVAHEAVVLSLDALAAEAKKPAHAKAVQQTIDSQTQTTKNLLTQLESALDRLQAAKAALRWLAAPVYGNRAAALHSGELFMTVESMRKKNGEPAGARELTAAVHEALLPEDQRQKVAQFPGGFPVAGQLEQTGAARAFAEQLAEVGA